MAQAKNRSDAKGDGDKVFRYWVEVRELKSGLVRTLPLSAIGKIYIPRKKSQEQKPKEEVLQLEDGAVTIEAKNLDDLAAQLRQRYPDRAYERTLHQERDREAEKRRADAMNELVRMIMDSFIKSLSENDAAALLGVWFKTKEGRKAFREAWPKIVDTYFYALCNPKR